MYRAIISSIGPTAGRPIYQFRKELLNQFLNSPMCSSVVVLRDPVMLDESLKSINNQKLTVCESLREVERDGVLNKLIVPEELKETISDLEFLDAVTALSSIYKNHDYKREILRKIHSIQPNKRLSLFRLGYMTQSNDVGLDCVPVTNIAKVVERCYPVASQFLPARFREISPQHLALAVRLNFETCEFSPSEDGIEQLDFVDCMKIIGLEERI